MCKRNKLHLKITRLTLQLILCLPVSESPVCWQALASGTVSQMGLAAIVSFNILDNRDMSGKHFRDTSLKKSGGKKYIVGNLPFLFVVYFKVVWLFVNWKGLFISVIMYFRESHCLLFLFQTIWRGLVDILLNIWKGFPI